MSNNTAIEKFTVGKWVTDTSHKFEREGITIWCDDQIIADVVEDHHGNHEANARLIAAAPETYFALKDAQNEICRLYNKLKELDFKNSLYYWNEEKAIIGKYDELINRINQ